MVDETLPRRKFLLGAGLAGASVALAGTVPAPAAAETAPTAPQPAARAEPETYLTLTATEVAFMSAMADTIIPADELSPSGTDCGVVTYIDRQLAGAYGAGAKMYRSGPFQRGKPEQGYQLALTPREYFAAGIEAANDWSRKTYGKELDRLSPVDRAAATATRCPGRCSAFRACRQPTPTRSMPITTSATSRRRGRSRISPRASPVPAESGHALGLIFGRIFYGEPAATSPENASRGGGTWQQN
jgi:gluconate 2-dehydrogenase gamma chain